MNEQIVNQVIGLSLIYAKRNNLPIKINIVTDKNKIPLVGYQRIKDLNVLNFSYYIVSRVFGKQFNRNVINDWRALNIYYMKMLNIKIDIINKNFTYQNIPFLKVEDINNRVKNEFDVNLYILADCYKEYLNFLNPLKIVKQRRHDINYIFCTTYNKIQDIINKRLNENVEKGKSEIQRIQKSIKDIENILYDNN